MQKRLKTLHGDMLKIQDQELFFYFSCRMTYLYRCFTTTGKYLWANQNGSNGRYGSYVPVSFCWFYRGLAAEHISFFLPTSCRKKRLTSTYTPTRIMKTCAGNWKIRPNVAISAHWDKPHAYWNIRERWIPGDTPLLGEWVTTTSWKTCGEGIRLPCELRLTISGWSKTLPTVCLSSWWSRAMSWWS